GTRLPRSEADNLPLMISRPVCGNLHNLKRTGLSLRGDRPQRRVFMPDFVKVLFDLASSQQWLVTANFILSVLLGLWMVRYRGLYFTARGEQFNTDELIDNLSEGIYRSLP